MKKLHKQPACLNCHRPLAIKDNFCPSCGQENTNSKLGVGMLFHDFFSNYFSFDSKLSRSAIPFLVKPGYLTQRFNEGKRTSFVHPLRLYLIISFLFSFSLVILVDKTVEANKISLLPMFATDNNTIQDGLSAEETAALPVNSTNVLEASSAQGVSADSLRQKPTVTKSTTSLVEIDDYELVNLLRDESLSDEEIIKKMKWETEGEHYRIFVHQSRKILQKDIDVFLPFVIKNLSIMMFLLLPVFAFYLYVLFGRKEKYYISHAIHALHLHSFSFMVITLLIVLELLAGVLSSNDWISLMAFFLVTLYAFFSIKRVYGQGWLRTFFKFNVLGFFYFFTLSISFFLELAVSFVLF